MEVRAEDYGEMGYIVVRKPYLIESIKTTERLLKVVLENGLRKETKKSTKLILISSRRHSESNLNLGSVLFSAYRLVACFKV